LIEKELLELEFKVCNFSFFLDKKRNKKVKEKIVLMPSA
jgi:hypothetical protein